MHMRVHTPRLEYIAAFLRPARSPPPVHSTYSTYTMSYIHIYIILILTLASSSTTSACTLARVVILLESMSS